MAAERLTQHGHEIVPVGIKKGEIFGQQILPIRQSPFIPDVHTITLYLGPRHQPEYYQYFLGLKAQRMIFNPGTENEELMQMARSNDIEVVEGCTLVMLSIGNY
jgi:predicted CoA-binding protein